LILPLISGCWHFTPPEINITPVEKWERRYDKTSEIVINGEKLDLENVESVWLLSNKTLYNLLKAAQKGR
jgi:hypothetical protein